MIQEIEAAQSGAVIGGVRWLLRLEGLMVLLAALAAYSRWGMEPDRGWGWWAASFLLPDLALLAYLAGPRAGALAYNVTHSHLGPLACLGLGLAGGPALLLPVALVWLAHIGLDRALGYGMKYGLGFGFTHLGRIGRIGAKRR